MVRTRHVQFHLSGDHDTAMARLRDALDAEQFTVTEQKPGRWKATHGSAAATMFGQGFAAADLQREIFHIEFSEDAGALVVDIRRPFHQMSEGNDVIEMVRLRDAYRASEEGLRDRLQAAGILASSSI